MTEPNLVLYSYADQVATGSLGEEQRERRQAQMQIERYEHYMGRYTSHEVSQTEVK